MKQNKKKIKALDLALILAGLYVLGFVIVTIVIYTTHDWPYDALFPYALGMGGIEGICTCIIQVSKYKNNKEDET